VDAAIDNPAHAWKDLSKLNPAYFGGGYPIRIPDYSGEPDGEPDSALVAELTSNPDRGVLTHLGGLE
jgi:hypothetical protein